jgi:class 3 adenylate cyclase
MSNEKVRATLSETYSIFDIVRLVGYGSWWFVEAFSPQKDWAYLAVWSLAVVYALVWGILQRIPTTRVERHPPLEYVPAICDVLATTAALWSAGGVNSWVAMVYVFGVVASAPNTWTYQPLVQLWASVASVTLTAWLAYFGWIHPINVLGGATYATLGETVACNILVVTVLFLAYFIVHSLAVANKKANDALAAERERSESLLLNILPESISHRLKAGERPIADTYSAVSVVFADIVEFTAFTKTMPAGRLVSLLDELFRRVDVEARRLGVEKIKTIGDCYMAVAGIPDPCLDHADRAVSLGRAFLECVRDFNAKHGTTIRARVGISSGPAVAGVIGEHKYNYDLWGDAVNTASRMESHGIADAVMLSDTTRTALLNDYPLQDNGVKQIRGKGPLQTWLLAPNPL